MHCKNMTEHNVSKHRSLWQKFNFIEANARNALGGKKLGPKVHGKRGSLSPEPPPC